MKYQYFWLRACFSVLIIGSMSCSDNLFKEMADQTEDKALLQKVKSYLNDADYASAVTVCEDMPASYIAKREPAYYCASAYAGRCGLEMVGFINYFGALGANPVLDYMMDEWPTAAAYTQVQLTGRLDDCQMAEDYLQAIGAAAARTTNENALITLVALKKLGLLAKAYSDYEGTAPGNDNDNAVDAEYDSCDPADLPNAAVQRYGSAFYEIAESAALSGIPDGSSLATIITTASDLIMTSLNGFGIPAAVDFMLAADPENFNANELYAIRTLVKAVNTVFGLDCNGVYPACECYP